MDDGLAAAIADVEGLRRHGDLLLAFDRAVASLKSWPDSERLKHSALLALARAGATAHAQQLFKEWGLEASSDPDVLAIEARLAKDRALKLSGERRQAGLAEAAALYRRVHEKSPGYYTAINAASVAYLSGDPTGAAEEAREVLADPAIAGAADYWALATRAEAQLLLGDRAAAARDLGLAAATGPNSSDMSSTRRQLRLILTEAGASAQDIAGFLMALAPPATLHFSSAALPSQSWMNPPDVRAETLMRQRIEALVAAQRPGSALGSLGTPAEILFAEAVLAAGAQLDAVVPVRAEVLRNTVLEGGGAAWAARFDACCAGAARVVLPSDDPEATDTSHAAYAIRVGMGLALLRAQHIDGMAVQVLLEDAAQPEAPGTVATSEWTAQGRDQIVVPLADAAAVNAGAVADTRPTRAVIFGDLLGFSQLREQQLPLFWETVMKIVGEVVDERAESVQLRNTWGDAVHLVLADVGAAARICLKLQQRLAGVDARIFARDTPLAMRIGAHYGPVFTGWDPVVHQETYYGRALSKAARIEPITPPGTVYVSEAFAAILLLETGQEFSCSYVGVVPLAKGFGDFRMYDLIAA